MNFNINKKIAYIHPETGLLAIVHPTGEDSLEDTIKMSVPPGLPYWFLDESDIPEDRSFRDAWELDAETMLNPDGVRDEEL
jgi:hypothetical protein